LRQIPLLQLYLSMVKRALAAGFRTCFTSTDAQTYSTNAVSVSEIGIEVTYWQKSTLAEIAIIDIYSCNNDYHEAYNYNNAM